MEEGARPDQVVLDSSSSKIKLTDRLRQIELLFCTNLDKVFIDSKRLRIFGELIKLLPVEFYSVARRLNFDITGPISVDDFLSGNQTDKEKLRALCNMVSRIAAYILSSSGEVAEQWEITTIDTLLNALASSSNVTNRDMMVLYFRMEESKRFQHLVDFSVVETPFLKRLWIDFVTHLFYWLVYSQRFSESGVGGVYFRLSDKNNTRVPREFYDIALKNFKNHLTTFWWKGEDNEKEEGEWNHHEPFGQDVVVSAYIKDAKERKLIDDDKVFRLFQDHKSFYVALRHKVNLCLKSGKAIDFLVGGKTQSGDIIGVPCMKMFTFTSWGDALAPDGVPVNNRYWRGRGYYTQEEEDVHENDLQSLASLVPAPNEWLDPKNRDEVDECLSLFLLRTDTAHFWEYCIANILLLFDQYLFLKSVELKELDGSDVGFFQIPQEQLSFKEALRLCFKQSTSGVAFPKIRLELAKREPALKKFLFGNPRFFADADELRVFWSRINKKEEEE